MRIRKKLIEVSLPLDAINKAAAHEKMPGIGPHPRGLHLWWARRPLAAARAVIFSQMVDDPSTYVDVLFSDPKKRRQAEAKLKARHKVWEEARAISEKARLAGIAAPAPSPEPELAEIAAEIERERLFAIIRKLVLWKNATNEDVLQEARDEIWQSWRRACAENADHPRAKELFDRHRLPAFHDPFAGGGALPIEAQRLGMESHASDLNPVAVLINKAMIEIPPKFAGKPPVNPDSRKKLNHSQQWQGSHGLAEDVRYYATWMLSEAKARIGHLYPGIEVSTEMTKGRTDLKKYVGTKLSVIAWLWARTVKSPNPAFRHVDVPLVSTFALSTKAGKEAYVDPIVENGNYQFSVRVGKPKDPDTVKNGTKLSRGANFQCVMSGTPIAGDYIKAEGSAGRMGTRLMAIVADGDRERVYLPPTPEHVAAALLAKPEWKPESSLPNDPRNFWTVPYGLTTYGDLFTPRQLVGLTTLSDLVQEARKKVKDDALDAGLDDFGASLDSGGSSATAYADAVSVYLAFAVDRCADFSNSCTRWVPGNQKVMNVFAKQAIAMAWDFPEAGILHQTVGGFLPAAEFISDCIGTLPLDGIGIAIQLDATKAGALTDCKLVSTDPPYYDNIGYADLSDFFYVWLRRSLRTTFPDLFATVAVPKAEELVATPYRHGGKEKAGAFFLNGMTLAMRGLAEHAHANFPVTIYYAYKESESDSDTGTVRTGWETFLDAVMTAGFVITGTWPMRSEQEYRMIGMGTNALASSIVLVCRRRPGDAPTVTRREFMAALKAELPHALEHLQRGNIAPGDLDQAAIGPGMAIYTRYAKVLDAEGKLLTIRQALALINEVLDESLAQQEGDFDSESRWAISWFDSHGFDAGSSGEAILRSTARGTALNALEQSGIVVAKGGKVRLLRPAELPEDWNPATDPRLTAWEIVHHLIRTLEGGGETATAQLISQLGIKAEIGRELAYRLFNICDRKKRAPEALSYNALVQSWAEIMRLARESGQHAETQTGLFA